MEERYRNLTASTSGAAAASSAGSSSSKPSVPHGQPADAAVVPEKSKQLPGASALAEGGASPSGLNPGRCSCNRLAMYVLDISRALSEEHEVEWLPFRSNASLAAPEETILYTLVAGRSGRDLVSFHLKDYVEVWILTVSRVVYMYYLIGCSKFWFKKNYSQSW